MGNQRMINLRNLISKLIVYWRCFVIAFTPVILLPVLINAGQKGRCGYMMLLMGVYWVSEVLPLPVTGLLPVFLAPTFGILTSAEVTANYMKDVTVMLVGGLFVAVAIERTMLHKRIALSALKLMGTSPQWLMLGFMLPTFMCSMFITNTAAAAMMLPIMEAVLNQLSRHTTHKANASGKDNKDTVSEGEGNNNTNDATSSLQPLQCKDIEVELNDMSATENTATSTEHKISTRDTEQSPYMQRIGKGMTLAICYAANIGGTATVTGAYVSVKWHADTIWSEKEGVESPMTISSYIAYAVPTAILNLLLIYIWLVLHFIGLRAFTCKQYGNPEQNARVKSIINNEYRQLGRVRCCEVVVMAMFACLVLLWFFRVPGFIDGWSVLFKDGYVSDAVSSVFIATLLFCIPMDLPDLSAAKPTRKTSTLLTWPDVHEKFPWGLLFLIGGGFSLAQCAQVSGLSEWIGDQLSIFGGLPGYLMIAVICLMVAMLTEVTSNSATCTILMPIMASMSEKLGRNPLYLMLPTAISTSFAFMLPVATPPNAIAFSYGRITVFDMVKCGFLPNFICVFAVTLATNTWGSALYGLDRLPWSNDSLQLNSTSALSTILL